MESDKSCPICYEDYSELIFKDGIKSHDFGDMYNCIHYFCAICLEKMGKNHLHKCPICRMNILPLIKFHGGENIPMTFSDIFNSIPVDDGLRNDGRVINNFIDIFR